MTRVLMTADAVGGVWTFALDLGAALVRHGVRTTLAVMGPPPSPAQRNAARARPGIDLREAPFALEWMDDPWDDLRAAGEWLLALEREVAPDVVHLNGYCHGALPWRAPVVMTGHSCVRSWWEAVHGEPAPPGWRRYAAAVRQGLAAAGIVTAPSAEMLAALQRHYGPLRHARVIPNGRRLTPVAAPKEPLVLTAGRLWDRAKNVELVCASAARLPWPVYVAGATVPPEGAARAVPEHGHVRFLGRLDSGTLEVWMARAAVYALPARYEPFGLSILEAALCGCALVLGDRPSLREIWADAALYVPADDEDGLVEAISTLAERDAFRELMAARGVRRAQELTPERMADAYRTAYEELAGEIRPLLSLGTV